jgi:hypothetical protein
MNTVARKKSPRAPSIALGDAIEKACKIYDMDRCHAVPIEAAATHIGYKNAANGAAMSTLASLKYYGLLERPKEGMLAVSRDVEAFRFAPSETIKQTLITKWLKSPPVFAELLDKYTETLPSDATLKFELIQKGFAPVAADLCLQVFRRSVDYAHYFEQSQSPQVAPQAVGDVEIGEYDLEQIVDPIAPATVENTPTKSISFSNDADRIPVRLAGGRRAWIEIPMPFYEADKVQLKKQIDLLLTNDEESDDELI